MAEPTCNDSGSRETVVTSLIANGVIFIVFIVVFLILRPLNKRVYDSRSMSSEMSPGDKPRELRGGKFGWIFDLLTRSDAEICETLVWTATFSFAIYDSWAVSPSLVSFYCYQSCFPSMQQMVLDAKVLIYLPLATSPTRTGILLTHS